MKSFPAYRNGGLLQTFFLLAALACSRNVKGQDFHSILSNWVEQSIQLYPKSEDTARVMALIRESSQVSIHNPDSAIKLYQKSINLSRIIGFSDGIAMALIGIGRTESHRGNPEKSLEFLHHALPYCRRPVYYKELLSNYYNNVGYVYFSGAHYDKAAHYFDSALQAEKKLNLAQPTRRLSRTYNNLGAVYTRIGQAKDGMQYLRQAEKISRTQQLPYELALTLVNIGQAYIGLNQYEKGRQTFLEGLTIAQKHHYTTLEQAFNNSLGELMLHQNKPREAVAYLKQTEKLGKDLEPLYSAILPGYYSLALAYYQLKEYKKAEAQLLLALKLARQLALLGEQIRAYQILSHIYEAMGDYPKALEQERMYSVLKDSIFNKEKAKDLNELKIKYNSSQKDKQLIQTQLKLTQQQVSIQRKNTWIWLSVLGILLITSTSFLIYRNIRHKQHVLTGKINILEQDQEIKLLKASLDGEERERIRIGRELHDGIGGLLSAVKLQFGKLRIQHDELKQAEDFNQAITLIDEATGEVRKIAHNLMPEILWKGGIEAAVKSFCERIGSTLRQPQIEVQVYGRIPRMNSTFELSIYRIIQELINNALKHAQATVILIQLSWQESFFHITIEDNGRGMSTADLKDTIGIGLKNITSRVETMQGNIEIESTKTHGTCIYMDFDTDKIK